LPAGTPIPAANESKSSFWDFFSFSKKSVEGQPVPPAEALGPGALNVPVATETK